MTATKTHTPEIAVSDDGLTATLTGHGWTIRTIVDERTEEEQSHLDFRTMLAPFYGRERTDPNQTPMRPRHYVITLQVGSQRVRFFRDKDSDHPGRDWATIPQQGHQSGGMVSEAVMDHLETGAPVLVSQVR